jgi:hypothetical protein
VSPTKLKITFFSVLAFLLALFVFFLVSITNSKYKNKDASVNNLSTISVIVLNGCGVSKAASRFQDYLISKHINAKIPGNGNTRYWIYNKTIIAVKKKDGEKLKELIKLTGIKRWFYAENKNSDIDFEILVGNDFEEYLK